MTGNAWERLGMAGKRANKTAGQRDRGTTRRRYDETARQRDNEKTRQQDNKTTRRRDDETTRLRKMRASPAISRSLEVPKSRKNLRRSQAFPGILSHSQPCAVVRGSLASEGVRCGASQKKAPRDSTKTYSPWCFTFWDVPQIAPYHVKLKALRTTPSALAPY